MQFPMLWSVFTYIITHHVLGEFSGLINGLIAAAISALSMLTSEPTANSNVKRTRMLVLSFVTLHYIRLQTVIIIIIIIIIINIVIWTKKINVLQGISCPRNCSTLSLQRSTSTAKFLVNSLRHLNSKQSIVLYIPNDSNLFSRLHPPFQNEKQRVNPLTLTDCRHKYYATKYFWGFPKIFFWT